MAVVDQYDEVGQILAHLRPETVRHFEAEIMVLDVGANLGCASATRQNSPSQSLSRTTQLMWQDRELVSQRSAFEVLKRTCMVEPVGL
jgi:hypothetical protein